MAMVRLGIVACRGLQLRSMEERSTMISLRSGRSPPSIAVVHLLENSES